MNRFTCALLFAVPLVAGCLGSFASAQCGLQWLPGQLPGTDGQVRDLVLWDRDGAGPLPPLVVVGGSFHAVGQLPANGVAAYDPATMQWTSLGSGVDGDVRCAAVLANGDLVVGGSFTQAGGNVAACIARWDGVAWSALGNGITGGASTYVDALAVAPNGDLVAGGSFTAAGSVVTGLVARWNGASWSACGAGLTGVVVNALTHLPDGSLVAGGTFWQAGGLAVHNIARFDGVAWSSLGAGLTFLSNNYPGVYALQVLGNGHLVAGGAFETSGPTAVGCIAEWDGATWSPIGQGLGGVNALALASGQLVAIAPGGSGWSAIRWNGTSWTSLGPAVSWVSCTAVLPNGDLVIGGTFSSAGGVAMHNVARLNGSTWVPVVSASVPFVPMVRTLLAMSNGDLVAANLTQSPSRVSRRSGSIWSPLPGLATSLSTSVFPAWFAELANGDLVLFASSAGLLRWNGATWVTVGMPGSFALPQALLSLPDGSLLVAGTFAGIGGSVVRWDGATWTSWVTGHGVIALGRLANGDVVAGGTFQSIGGVAAARVARFDGSQWHPLGSGVDNVVRTLTTFADGSVVVAGDFANAGSAPAPRIARWNGSAWSRFGAGMVPKRLASLPDGEVVAVGDLTIAGVTRTDQLARSVGQQWTTFAPGLNGIARDVVVLPNGNVAVAGDFTNAGGFGSAYVAELASTCAATALAYGNGCAGSAGPVTLLPVHLPWLGGLCQCRGTGIAANGLAFGVIGWSATTTPLVTFHPAAGAGCMALASPDAVAWLPVFAGAVTWSFGVPNAPALVGVTLREQIVHAELGPLGDLVLLSSSNGIALTVGSL